MLLWLKTKLASNYATSAFNIYYETGSNSIKVGFTQKRKSDFLNICKVLLSDVKSLCNYCHIAVIAGERNVAVADGGK